MSVLDEVDTARSWILGLQIIDVTFSSIGLLQRAEGDLLRAYTVKIFFELIAAKTLLFPAG